MALDLSIMGFGITSTVSLEIVRELAPRIEAAGFRTLWINHTATGDSMESMQVAASVTSTLRLGSGVIPVDRVTADDIAQSVQKRDLPLDRVVLGIGSSAKPSPLTLVKDATETLHERLGASVFVGALGPKMRRLGVRKAEGVLLNWLTPDAARQAVAEKDHDLADLSAKQAEVALYVRTALGRESREVLEQEAARYAGLPSYRANFERLGFQPMDSTVYGNTPEEIRAGLAPYMGTVDEFVVRGVTPGNTLDEFLALVDAVAN